MLSQFDKEIELEKHDIKPKTNHYLFKDDWRVSLTNKEKDIFFMLSSINFDDGYTIIQDLVSLSNDNNISNFLRSLYYLEEECYIKLEKKYKKINGIICSVVKIICFDPKGNIYKNV